MLPTCALDIRMSDQLGNRAANIRVEFLLSTTDIDHVTGEIVTPKKYAIALDSEGRGTVNLWPNERGRQNTQYYVRALTDSGYPFWQSTIVVPNTSTALFTSILNAMPPAEISEALAAQLKAQSALAQIQDLLISGPFVPANALILWPQADPIPENWEGTGDSIGTYLLIRFTGSYELGVRDVYMAEVFEEGIFV